MGYTHPNEPNFERTRSPHYFFISALIHVYLKREGNAMNPSDDSSIHPIHRIQMFAGGSPFITLSRIYQGVALFDSVEILEIQADAVLLKTKNSLVLADYESDFYLHSLDFPQPIRGRMLQRDLSSSILTLGALTYMPEHWKERYHVRVKPSEPVFVTMKKMGHDFRACLLDLDETGLGATTDSEVREWIADKMDGDLSIFLQLTPNLSIKALRGKVCYTRDINRRTVRLGIRTTPTRAQIKQLNLYIEERRAQIMANLRDAFLHELSPTPVQNLFF